MLRKWIGILGRLLLSLVMMRIGEKRDRGMDKLFLAPKDRKGWCNTVWQWWLGSGLVWKGWRTGRCPKTRHCYCPLKFTLFYLGVCLVLYTIYYIPQRLLTLRLWCVTRTRTFSFCSWPNRLFLYTGVEFGLFVCNWNIYLYILQKPFCVWEYSCINLAGNAHAFYRI